MSMSITSPAFGSGEAIPVRHTCDGPDLSPPLDWTGVPADARSLVLIVEDPDSPDPAAPKLVWVHWAVYNLPPDIPGLAEGLRTADLPRGGLEARNNWNRTGYSGPCPAIGQHRYFHRLYALDTVLPDLQAPSKERLVQAMDGHILAEAELVGIYKRHR